MKFDNTLDSYHNTVLTIEGNDNCPDCIVSILGVSPKQSLNVCAYQKSYQSCNIINALTKRNCDLVFIPTFKTIEKTLLFFWYPTLPLLRVEDTKRKSRWLTALMMNFPKLRQTGSTLNQTLMMTAAIRKTVITRMIIPFSMQLPKLFFQVHLTLN